MNINYITIQLNKLDNAIEFATLFIIIGGLVAAFYYIKNRKKDGSNQPDYYIPEPMDGQRPQHREDLTEAIQPMQEQQANVMDEQVPF